MKYTTTIDAVERTFDIPEDYIRTMKRTLGLSTTEAIHMWLFDNGYETNAEAEALTNKAKSASSTNAAGTKRKSPTRKPNETKRKIINILKESLGQSLNVEVEMLNVERLLEFEYAGHTYSLTLSQKRTPK